MLNLKSVAQTDTAKVFYSVESALLNPIAAKFLDLSGSNLVELPASVTNLTNLEKIDLGSNPNLNLRQAFILLSHLNKLKTLWLTDGKLSNIPNEISKLTNLDEICLDNNQLKEFPASIKKLKQLKRLRLFSNGIKNINLRNGDLPNLISIDLCYNKFKTFPVQLSHLINLKRIIIWYNDIKTIPQKISLFNLVEEINLEHNQLTKLPSQITKLKALTNLSLRENHITNQGILPVFDISSLKQLDIESNDITKLSTRIENLKELTNLSICDNQISVLPNELSKLQNIEQLGLGDMHKLDWTKTFYILQKLHNLKRVGMYSMKLDKMPQGFDKLTQVETFWLTYSSFNVEEKERIKKMLPNASIEFE